MRARVDGGAFVFTLDEEHRCPNPSCQSGFEPIDGRCVDCGTAHRWPEDMQVVEEHQLLCNDLEEGGRK